MVKPKCFNLLELKSPEAPAVLRALSLCSLPFSRILSNLICISEQSAKGNAWARGNGVGDKNNRFHTEALPSDTVMIHGNVKTHLSLQDIDDAFTSLFTSLYFISVTFSYSTLGQFTQINLRGSKPI